MGKAKISAKRERSSRSTKSEAFNIEEHKPDASLKDTALIRKALVEAFFEGDVEGFKEILAAHLRAISKDEISKHTGVSRATVFRMLDRKSNPSFENVAKVVSTLKIA